jgi:hypothetical protein
MAQDCHFGIACEIDGISEGMTLEMQTLRNRRRPIGYMTETNDDAFLEVAKTIVEARNLAEVA